MYFCLNDKLDGSDTNIVTSSEIPTSWGVYKTSFPGSKTVSTRKCGEENK